MNASIYQSDLSSFSNDRNSDCQLLDFKSIGSYSLVNDKNYKINIPGTPAILQSHHTPFYLESPKEIQIVDANAFFFPNNPMDALFESVKVISSDFSFENVEIVTDRTILRKLIKFITGSWSYSDIEKKISFGAERVNNTVVLVRKDTSYEVIENASYGFEFEKYMTNGEKSYYKRIVSYKLSNISIVMRFEVDGVFDSNEKDYDKPIVELKSKNANYPLKCQDYEDFWAQMFFSKTDLLLLGLRREDEIVKLTLLTLPEIEILSEFANKNAKNIILLKLVRILRWIIDYSQSHNQSERFLIEYNRNENKLNIFSDQSSSNTLSNEVKNIIRSVNNNIPKENQGQRTRYQKSVKVARKVK